MFMSEEQFVKTVEDVLEGYAREKGCYVFRDSKDENLIYVLKGFVALVTVELNPRERSFSVSSNYSFDRWLDVRARLREATTTGKKSYASKIQE